MRKLISTSVLALALLANPAQLWAHAHLNNTVPGVGSTVHAAPTELRLTFSEAVEPRFSKITLTSASGAVIETEAPVTDHAHHETLVVKIKAPLAGGTYQVNWQAVSVDTHRVEGSYNFTIGH